MHQFWIILCQLYFNVSVLDSWIIDAQSSTLIDKIMSSSSIELNQIYCIESIVRAVNQYINHEKRKEQLLGSAQAIKLLSWILKRIIVLKYVCSETKYSDAKLITIKI